MGKLLKVLVVLCLVFLPTKLDSEEIKPYTGAAILALLNPKFPVDDAIQLLKVIPASERSFAFVYGIFGRGNRNYTKLMQGINNKSHTQIYILSSPTRKPRRDGRMEFFYPELTIEQFNRKLPKSKAMQNKYKKLVLNIYNKFIKDYPTVQFTLVPELESTLTKANTNLLINLTLESLGGREINNIDIAVNNLRYTKLNLPIEVHSLSELKYLKKGDSFSLDGLNLPISEISRLYRELNSRGVNFYFWYDRWQGLDLSKPSNKVLLPHERNYIINNISEIKNIIN